MVLVIDDLLFIVENWINFFIILVDLVFQIIISLLIIFLEGLISQNPIFWIITFLQVMTFLVILSLATLFQSIPSQMVMISLVTISLATISQEDRIFQFIISFVLIFLGFIAFLAIISWVIIQEVLQEAYLSFIKFYNAGKISCKIIINLVNKV